MKILVTSIFVTLYATGLAQWVPAFKALRFEEDYTILKRDTVKNWYRKMKYQSLKQSGDSHLSFGGDIRFQYLYFRNENWGEAPNDKDGYMLTRYLVHADLHVNKPVRIFAQLQSSQVNSKAYTSPVDEDPLEMHQLFFDWNMAAPGPGKISLRLGRQELVYGSQRLVSYRDGPNNRLSFDGLKMMYSRPGYSLDLFYTHPVASNKGIFDDNLNKNVKFWGAYLASNNKSLPLKFDLYYFGLWKSSAKFDDGAATETRHSAGTRLWNNVNNWRYDIEGVWQFGKYGVKQISAWTLSVNTGYKFQEIPLKPEPGIKTELISGDLHNDDNKLQTFNPLFPRGGYFGLVSLIGPSNLFDIHPSLGLELSKKVFLNFDYDIFWRYSRNDGLYGPNVALLYPGKKSNEKFVGKQFSGDLVYIPNSFLYFRAELTWFNAGGFLRDNGPGKDILFTAVTAQVRF